MKIKIFVICMAYKKDFHSSWISAMQNKDLKTITKNDSNNQVMYQSVNACDKKQCI